MHVHNVCVCSSSYAILHSSILRPWIRPVRYGIFEVVRLNWICLPEWYVKNNFGEALLTRPPTMLAPRVIPSVAYRSWELNRWSPFRSKSSVTGPPHHYQPVHSILHRQSLHQWLHLCQYRVSKVFASTSSVRYRPWHHGQSNGSESNALFMNFQQILVTITWAQKVRLTQKFSLISHSTYSNWHQIDLHSFASSKCMVGMLPVPKPYIPPRHESAGQLRCFYFFNWLRPGDYDAWSMRFWVYFENRRVRLGSFALFSQCTSAGRKDSENLHHRWICRAHDRFAAGIL